MDKSFLGVRFVECVVANVSVRNVLHGFLLGKKCAAARRRE
jgi:hypothetical protein